MSGNLTRKECGKYGNERMWEISHGVSDEELTLAFRIPFK